MENEDKGREDRSLWPTHCFLVANWVKMSKSTKISSCLSLENIALLPKPQTATYCMLTLCVTHILDVASKFISGDFH